MSPVRIFPNLPSSNYRRIFLSQKYWRYPSAAALTSNFSWWERERYVLFVRKLTLYSCWHALPSIIRMETGRWHCVLAEFVWITRHTLRTASMNRPYRPLIRLVVLHKVLFCWPVQKWKLIRVIRNPGSRLSENGSHGWFSGGYDILRNILYIDNSLAMTFLHMLIFYRFIDILWHLRSGHSLKKKRLSWTHIRKNDTLFFSWPSYRGYGTEQICT